MRSMRLIALVLIVIASLSHGDVVIPVFPEDENLSMRCGPYTALLNAMTQRTPPSSSHTRERRNCYLRVPSTGSHAASEAGLYPRRLASSSIRRV